MDVAPVETRVAGHYAHFEDTLETLLIGEIGNDLHQACLSNACEPFGLTASRDTHKIPEVMHHTLRYAKERDATCETLEALVRAIWLHLTGENVGAEDDGKRTA